MVYHRRSYISETVILCSFKAAQCFRFFLIAELGNRTELRNTKNPSNIDQETHCLLFVFFLPLCSHAKVPVERMASAFPTQCGIFITVFVNQDMLALSVKVLKKKTRKENMS